QTLGKPAGMFVESPAAVMQRLGWTEPRYARNDPFNGGLGVWGNEYGDASSVIEPLGFYEIFTGGRGPLTGEEVRKAEAIAGVFIDDSTAVRQYNTKLAL